MTTSAAVANLIGYSYRKLGDYKVSQIWYERALKADPNHVKTWQYYGLWQVEQGNRDQAQYHLNRIAQLTGTDKRGISLARRRAGKAAGHRVGLLMLSGASILDLRPCARTAQSFAVAGCENRSNPAPAFVLFTSSAPSTSDAERLARAVARIEHVAAGIDDELHPVRTAHRPATGRG